MKKINIIKKKEDFNRIIRNIKAFKFKYFIIYKEYNDDNYKFGISVSKKIGNAVVRNKIKRQVKNIIDKMDYQKNFNCIIIIRKDFLNLSFKDKEKYLKEAFKKLNLLKGE